MMLDPKTSLAIDAPPIAPYDDGFSTDSEDFTYQGDITRKVYASSLSIGTSISVPRAAVNENQSASQRQQIQSGPLRTSIKQASGKEPLPTSSPVLKIEGEASKQVIEALKPLRNEHFKPQNVAQTAVLNTGDKKNEEEHCRNCKGYLTPLSERLRMMKTAALQQPGKWPPPSRQCCCCCITYPLVALTDASRNRACLEPRCYMCNWAAISAKKRASVIVTGVKRTVNGAVKNVGECCRSCKGKLTPLVERLKMMKEAMLHHKEPGPPTSRQCFCCHVTYPLSALAMKSRQLTCPTAFCEMCGSPTNNGMKTEGSSSGTAKKRDNVPSEGIENTQTATKTELKTGSKDSNNSEVSGANENCCRNCKGVLPSLAERLGLMNSTTAQLKEQGWRVAPPSRQCTCCFITFPLASLTEKSRSVMCAKPICYTCDDARILSSVTEDKAPSLGTVSNSAEPKHEMLPGNIKTTEIMVIDGGDEDEEGELLEQRVCTCCNGKLIPLVKRVQMMKNAAQQYGGKGSPPSRQCACCRVTYPSAALTKKSRTLARAVPICRNCSDAGGTTIYEMLAVSDEYIEAFKVENPCVARLLLQKKANGSLNEAVKNQRIRMLKKSKRPQTLKKDAPSAKMMKKLKEIATPPVYKRKDVSARKCIGARRLFIGGTARAGGVVSQQQTSQEASEITTPSSERNFLL